MTGLPPNSRLVLAVHNFLADPKKNLVELIETSTLEVEGALYQQLRDAAKRAIRAPASDLHLVLDGLRDIFRAIGAEVEQRRRQKFSDEPPADLPGQRPVGLASSRAMPLRTPRPAQIRMPYADD